jgi:hypothetical protein
MLDLILSVYGFTPSDALRDALGGSRLSEMGELMNEWSGA